MKRFPWWVWVVAIPFGFGVWAIVVPGVERRRWSWVALGVTWTAVVLFGATADDTGLLEDRVAGMVVMAGWIGGLATVFAIRSLYLQEPRSSFELDKAAAARRLRERRDAQRVAVEDPDLAKELGIGRPDLSGARAAGLIDVNNVPPSALTELPGIDEVAAARIVELREELNGLSSVHELGDLLELDGHAVERLRDRAVFLPR